ncbi:hypothetical protein ALP60_200109 [Pseudomonas savastanoi]|uniref:Uncharacterized protein n=1 Tax=Pseudomonas savastanoi TaxID=29438 RepID=A0A3M5FSD0_PSESS|nr:hypothetical protein ALP60_200109 [Pseudomonas savastanoi]
MRGLTTTDFAESPGYLRQSLPCKATDFALCSHTTYQ